MYTYGVTGRIESSCQLGMWVAKRYIYSTSLVTGYNALVLKNERLTTDFSDCELHNREAEIFSTF